MNPKVEKKRVSRRKRPVLLTDEERYRLLFGPYEPPLVKRGFLVDAVRGKVPFGGFSNALIPWPKAKRGGKSGSGGFVLCGDLVRALAKESAPAISHHWAVRRMEKSPQKLAEPCRRSRRNASNFTSGAQTQSFAPRGGGDVRTK